MDPAAFELLSWRTVLSWETFPFLVVGFALVIVVSLRPSWLWSVLIVTAILGNMPRIKGYVILDELFLGCIVLAALLRLSVLKESHPKGVSDHAHRGVFLLWMSYMVLQSVVGSIVNEDSRLIRWVVLYVLLGLLSSIISRRREFPVGSFRHITLAILLSTSAGYAMYVVHGMVLEYFFGTQGRFGGWGTFGDWGRAIQDRYWAGSSYATFISLVGWPSAIFLMRDRCRKVRLLVWIYFGLEMVVGWYYDSRVTWLVMGAFLAASIHKFAARQVVVFGMIFALLFGFFTGGEREEGIGDRSREFFGVLVATSGAFWAPQESDVSRNLQLWAGVATAAEDLKTFLLGAGVFSHRVLIFPHIEQLYTLYLPEKYSFYDTDPEWGIVFRTTAFNALLIDTGLVGMALMGANIVLVGQKVLKTRGRSRIISLLILPTMFLWLFVNNIQDVVLFYLLIMPNGLVEQLAHGYALRSSGRRPAVA